MDRPRRSSRAQPARQRVVADPPLPSTSTALHAKRKIQDDLADPATFIRFVLQNPKSPLTTMDISDLVNATNWNLLSAESQEALKTLLPPTAFLGFRPSIDPNHPSSGAGGGDHAMAADPAVPGPSSILEHSFFTDPHFLAAAHTFQDHIFSDWTSDSHAEKVNRYEAGVQNGTLSAAWKDEVWERNNVAPRPPLTTKEQFAHPSGGGTESSARAGLAAEVKLYTLAKNDVVRVGDVIAYKRTFTHADLVIEKDAIIQDIHPKSYHLTLLFPSGTTKRLPTSILIAPVTELASTEVDDSPVRILSATITSPTMLETALLDTDARVEKARRPNGNAWKCFTVYRWRGDEVGNIDDARGGRENHGTLFYLRGTYYHER